jgi:hypothetical protein
MTHLQYRAPIGLKRLLFGLGGAAGVTDSSGVET